MRRGSRGAGDAAPSRPLRLVPRRRRRPGPGRERLGDRGAGRTRGRPPRRRLQRESHTTSDRFSLQSRPRAMTLEVSREGRRWRGRRRASATDRRSEGPWRCSRTMKRPASGSRTSAGRTVRSVRGADRSTPDRTVRRLRERGRDGRAGPRARSTPAAGRTPFRPAIPPGPGRDRFRPRGTPVWRLARPDLHRLRRTLRSERFSRRSARRDRAGRLVTSRTSAHGPRRRRPRRRSGS